VVCSSRWELLVNDRRALTMDSWILAVLIALAAMVFVGGLMWLRTCVALDRVRNARSTRRRTPKA
jgi:hypothetical protein